MIGLLPGALLSGSSQPHLQRSAAANPALGRLMALTKGQRLEAFPHLDTQRIACRQWAEARNSSATEGAGQKFLEKYNLTPSMAVAEPVGIKRSISVFGPMANKDLLESIFKLLKRKRILSRTYKIRALAGQNVLDYTETFCKLQRKYVRNGMMLLIKFE